MEQFVERFAQHGYLAVFVLMLLESACIPIPSEVTMLFAGFLASPDHPTNAVQLSFVVVALMGVAGNVAGSWLAYGVGRAVGRAPLDRWGRYVGIRSHDIDRAERWWAKRGTATVFFSRMLPVIRTFISLPAGIEEMPFSRFTIYTTAGCVPWVFALTGIGYALGQNWHTLVGSFRYATYAIAALVVAAFVWYVVRRRRAEPRSG
ncbi:MAG: DedA family protein [Actinobacteria bacterium]|nr:MAG: DedA family protein [Actinomycetota bacterium]